MASLLTLPVGSWDLLSLSLLYQFWNLSQWQRIWNMAHSGNWAVSWSSGKVGRIMVQHPYCSQQGLYVVSGRGTILLSVQILLFCRLQKSTHFSSLLELDPTTLYNSSLPLESNPTRKFCYKVYNLLTLMPLISKIILRNWASQMFLA